MNREAVRNMTWFLSWQLCFLFFRWWRWWWSLWLSLPFVGFPRICTSSLETYVPTLPISATFNRFTFSSTGWRWAIQCTTQSYTVGWTLGMVILHWFLSFHVCILGKILRNWIIFYILTFVKLWNWRRQALHTKINFVFVNMYLSQQSHP